MKGSIRAAPYTAGTGSEMMLELLKVPLMAPSGYGMVWICNMHKGYCNMVCICNMHQAYCNMV